MAIGASAPGPTTKAIIDLDAGTTLPRAISIATAVLLVAGLAATLIAGQPADVEPAGAAMPRIDPHPIILPGWELRASNGPPTWTIGPSALVIDAAASATRFAGIGQ